MIAIGGTTITKAYLGQTELKNIAIGDKLLLRDKELAGVKNNSNAYINTGMKFTLGYTYTIVVDAASVEPSTNSFIFGARTQSVKGSKLNDNFNMFVPGPKGYITADIWERLSTSKQASSGISTYVLSYNMLIVNGNTVATGLKQTGGEYDICLFAVNTGGSISNPAHVTIYKYTVKDENGNMVLNLLPNENNGIVGFIDTISGVFYASPNGVSFEGVYK